MKSHFILASLLIVGTVGGASAADTLIVAMLPKTKDNSYFLSCKAGADRAAQELGIDLVYDGPTATGSVDQSKFVNEWVARGVNIIAVSAEDKAAIAPALCEAEKHGIKVIAFDADATAEARTFFVNQATAQGIAFALMDEAARLCSEEGEFAIITSSVNAPNQRDWEKQIRVRLVTKYPRMKLVAVRPSDDLRGKAQKEATDVIASHPNLRLLMSISAPATPAVAEAVKDSGKVGVVKVVGLGLPNENKPYVKAGVTDSVILWNTGDLGYLTVYAGVALAKGMLKPGATTIAAGVLGNVEIIEDNIFLGKPYVFNKANIDRFDF